MRARHAAPMTSPSRSRQDGLNRTGGPRTMSTKDKLKIAMFGAGRIGKVHTKNIAENAGLELAWICDPFIEGAQSLAEATGARTTTSADDVFDDDSVAAIIIGSPTNTHIDLISR